MYVGVRVEISISRLKSIAFLVKQTILEGFEGPYSEIYQPIIMS